MSPCPLCLSDRTAHLSVEVFWGNQNAVVKHRCLNKTERHPYGYEWEEPARDALGAVKSALGLIVKVPSKKEGGERQ